MKGGDEREVMIDDTGTDIETNIERFVSYTNMFNICSFVFLSIFRILCVCV